MDSKAFALSLLLQPLLLVVLNLSDLLRMYPALVIHLSPPRTASTPSCTKSTLQEI
jgi:hypothetical protein